MINRRTLLASGLALGASITTKATRRSKRLLSQRYFRNVRNAASKSSGHGAVHRIGWPVRGC